MVASGARDANISQIVCPLYGISLFLPTIIRTLGYTNSKAQLMTVPIYITAAILAVVFAYLSDKAGKRSPFIIGFLFVMLIGFSMYVLTVTCTVNDYLMANPVAGP